MRLETIVCDTRGHESRPAPHQIVLHGEPARVIELCPECIGRGVGALLEALAPAEQAAWADRLVKGE